MMKLTNYKKAYDIQDKLVKEFQFDYSKASKIVEFIEDRYIVFQRHKQQEYAGLWRLTYPFYLLFFITVFFIIAPIRWCFTGRFYFGGTKLSSFAIEWCKRLGI